MQFQPTFDRAFVQNISESVILNENFLKTLNSKIKRVGPESVIKILDKKNSAADKKLVKIKKAYEKIYNIDINKLENVVKNVVEKNELKIKSAIMKKDGNSIKQIFSKCVKYVTKTALQPITDIKDINFNSDEIGNSLGSMALLLVIGVFVQTLGMIVFGNPAIVMILSAIIYAPIVEEFFKRAAIKKKFGKEYIFVFSWIEFLMYVASFALMSNLAQTVMFALVRYLVVLMHYSAYNTQNYFVKKYTNAKDEQSRKDIIGYFVGLFIHGTWNTLAVAGVI